MKLTRILAIAVIAGSIGVVTHTGTGRAQILQQQPAEFPPASYMGKQYVDSQGCVFIRAGIDGGVSWVPRVTSDRKIVCGFKPSLEAEAAAPAEVAPIPAPIEVAAAPAVVVPVAEATSPPVVVASAPRRAAKPVKVRQPAPRRVQTGPQPLNVVPVSSLSADCQSALANSAQYVQGSGVRCVPQTMNIQPPKRIKTSVRGDEEVTAITRIVPKHVAENRANALSVVVPEGYRAVWTDGRLNPRRAEQNLRGRAQMQLVWTNTLPRRLVNVATGQDVTAKTPLIYPYTTTSRQIAELGEVTIVQRNGKKVKRVVRNAPATQAPRQPVYSSRSAPKDDEPARAASGKRYVQIGTYRDAGNAQRAAKSVAKMGIPARIGKRRKSGATYLSVQAGPFTDTRALKSAMAQLKSAGYSDAFLR